MITEKCSFDPPDDSQARLGRCLSACFMGEKSRGPERLNLCSRLQDWDSSSLGLSELSSLFWVQLSCWIVIGKPCRTSLSEKPWASIWSKKMRVGIC